MKDRIESSLKESRRRNLELGCKGENIARRYLEDKGYCVIEQNHKTKYAEIDIIARHNDTLVFVEVRTRSGERFGLPEESLNRDKIRKLIKSSTAYVSGKQYRGHYRIDAVCIVLDKYTGKVKRLDHYESL